MSIEFHKPVLLAKAGGRVGLGFSINFPEKIFLADFNVTRAMLLTVDLVAWQFRATLWLTEQP